MQEWHDKQRVGMFLKMITRRWWGEKKENSHPVSFTIIDSRKDHHHRPRILQPRAHRARRARNTCVLHQKLPIRDPSFGWSWWARDSSVLLPWVRFNEGWNIGNARGGKFKPRKKTCLPLFLGRLISNIFFSPPKGKVILYLDLLFNCCSPTRSRCPFQKENELPG